MIQYLKVTAWVRSACQLRFKAIVLAISLASCTVVTHNTETAAASAIVTAKRILEARCSESFSLEVISVSSESILKVNSNRPFFHVVLSASTANKPAGELDVFVFDGFVFFGFSVRENDLVGYSVRC